MHLRDQIMGTRLYSPPDDPAAPAVEPAVVVAPAADPAAVAAPAADPAVPAAVVAPVADPSAWKDKRIAELTAKLNAAKAAVPVTVAAPAPGETPEAFAARVDEAANAKAVEIAAINDWNSRCDAVASQGHKEFPDGAAAPSFKARLAACQSVVNPGDAGEVGQFNSVLAAAMETGQAHKLIYALGEKPEEMQRIMRLSPMKMAIEIANRAAKLGAGPVAEEPSGAPAPITPIKGGGAHYEGIDPSNPTNGTKLPIGEWMKQREKQAAAAGIQ